MHASLNDNDCLLGMFPIIPLEDMYHGTLPTAPLEKPPVFSLHITVNVADDVFLLLK